MFLPIILCLCFAFYALVTNNTNLLIYEFMVMMSASFVGKDK